ncbi:lipopolysaccharide/colanic/teichoic acid biosynthesis glycosyltransferase [Bacillus thermophilus]|uniref:Lipopolysaccharide/colanic/teichoic acid biosynthesis glycosyltransferase n=1 Tax=Siminovitchia thermophila TaxID=1245522 RepID=A0ABS2R5P5_9BACI|nr:sugar transferase [Siminovitchia thermophila]MBM7714951.1 lipopolysaccharide/colanic/teichoic acid biosynthesis glycosyltransferase [Siminovitchia thermophila]
MDEKQLYYEKGNKLNDVLKRTMDVILSLAGLVIISPLLFIISICIKLDSRGPVFFKQTRVGRYEEPFQIFKFRTMIVDAEKKGKQITVGKDSRITKTGQFLRKYKLDELPQLINVLIGDMSLVGPRPEVPKYTAYYTNEQKRIFEIRPGITDYASIKYRNENEVLAKSEDPEKTYIEEVMRDKLSLNLKYLDQQSVINDVKIIFMTIIAILR